MSVKFLSATLGPEMAAPILWAPGKNALFLQEKTVHKIPPFRGGGVFWVWGGECRFYFYGRGDFSDQSSMRHFESLTVRPSLIALKSLFSLFFLCDCSDQLQGVPGPPGPKCRKSLKKVVPDLPARNDLFETFSAIWARRAWHSL